MADSKALARQKKHIRTGGGSRNEGIWLSLDHLETLTRFLRSDPSAVLQGINAVAFMIGKLDGVAGAGGVIEYTVEVFPFKKTPLSGTPSTGTMMSTTVGGVLTEGALVIPAFPINNNGGGGGGNQKTPPPST